MPKNPSPSGEPAKPGRKRTQGQIDLDRAEIARLYLKGKPLWEITERINAVRSQGDLPYTITIHQVKKDMEAVRDEWIDRAAQSYDALVSRELARIDNLEAAAWAGYEASMADFEETTEKEVSGDEVRTEKQTRRRGQVGDPRFLERIGWCISERVKLLGLAAPDVHLFTAGKGVTFTLKLGEKEIGDEPPSE